MLAAGAGRAVGVDADVLLVEVDRDVVVGERRDVDLREAVWRRDWASNGEIRTSR